MRDEVQNSAKLFFSNELFLSRIYTVWALVCMVLFGFFAIGPLAFSMGKKVTLYKEMRALNYGLNVKLQSLSELSADVSGAERFGPILEATVPKELNKHSYMVLFMQQAAASGFSVKNFVSSAESEGGEVPIVVILEGTGELSGSISALEGMQRVTVVDSVKYEKLTDSAEATVNLRIFNL